MSNWSQILSEVEIYQDSIGCLNKKRAEYLNEIERITGRNIITYYSGFLRGSDLPNIEVNDQDMNAFMNAVYKLDKTKGLDLILHTPGGNIAATECIVEYLHRIFNNNIRAIIPQLSMSCGTMIAMSCNKIIMGNQSSLGPIDPQYGGIACQSIIDEFNQAKNDVMTNPSAIHVWRPILEKYHPTFVRECENAVKLSKDLATKWLQRVNNQVNMDKIETVFISHSDSYTHNRHISKTDCLNAGLPIDDLESNQALQDAVLGLHHCYMILFDKWKYSKVIENQIGGRYLQTYS